MVDREGQVLGTWVHSRSLKPFSIGARGEGDFGFFWEGLPLVDCQPYIGNIWKVETGSHLGWQLGKPCGSSQWALGFRDSAFGQMVTPSKIWETWQGQGCAHG